MAGGTTGGHVLSGLAIMLAYRDICDADVYFIGCGGSYENRLVPARGFELATIPGAPFARTALAGKIRAVAALTHGIVSARQLLSARQTQLVIGVGGYASAGAVLAAQTLGIPTVIHEANVVAGLANRVVARFADRVLIGWDEAGASFPKRAVAFTGNPVLPEIAAVSPLLRPGGEHQPVKVLVTGGSTGSTFLNNHVPELLTALNKCGVGIEVHHQSGEQDPEPIERAYARAGIPACVECFINDMVAAYRESQFVIAAAGAVTLAELSALGLPSLIVPIQAAANEHQLDNAKVYVRKFGGHWVSEAEWNVNMLVSRLRTTLIDPGKLAEQSRRLHASSRADAAVQIVHQCESVLCARASHFSV